MAKRVQIMVRDKGASRWRFMAHGAPYDMGGEAEAMQATLKAKGAMVRFLPVGRE